MLRWKAGLLLIPSESLANEAWCTPPAVHLPSIAFPPPPPPPPPVHVFQLSYACLSRCDGKGHNMIFSAKGLFFFFFAQYLACLSIQVFKHTGSNSLILFQFIEVTHFKQKCTEDK